MLFMRAVLNLNLQHTFKEVLYNIIRRTIIMSGMNVCGVQIYDRGSLHGDKLDFAGFFSARTNP